MSHSDFVARGNPNYRPFTAYVKCLEDNLDCGNGKTSIVLIQNHSNQRFDLSTKVIDNQIQIR